MDTAGTVRVHPDTHIKPHAPHSHQTWGTYGR